MIVIAQCPNAVKVIRQNNNGVDAERMPRTGVAERSSQYCYMRSKKRHAAIGEIEVPPGTKFRR
jgi:hypothetical protein